MKRILVVDDDHELAHALAFALEFQGYLVELATNGSDALERVRRARFDVVLVDWNMPVMDGRAFLREHVREAGTNVPPVVVMSGAPEAAAQALHLGATAVVAKPFRLEDLVALLARLTAASGGQVGCEC